MRGNRKICTDIGANVQLNVVPKVVAEPVSGVCVDELSATSAKET